MTENTPTPVIAPVPVIAGSDPQSMPEDDEISLLDLLQVVADNLRLLVLGPLVAGLLALGYSFTITPTFTATTKFMPPLMLKLMRKKLMGCHVPVKLVSGHTRW